MVETGTRVGTSNKQTTPNNNNNSNNNKEKNQTKNQKFASNNSAMNRVRIVKEEQTATV